MKEALITVKGYQYIDDDESCIEFKTLGKFGIKNGKAYILYSETEESGAITDTTIKVDEKETVLNRSGATESRMVIAAGKRNSCLYSTLQGNLVLEIYGERVSNQLTENGGTLVLEYTLNLNSTPVGRNKIEITVKEV